MKPRTSEAELVDALRAGDRDALARLYSDYSGPIYNLCARILGDREEAKDVTQEVFIKAFEQLPPPAEAGQLKLRAWLYRVAANACFNILRARRKLDGGGDEALTETASPVDEYQRAQTAALVEASLAEMNERYRTVLVLKDLHGLPPAEIAEVMEVSRPAADVLVHRARGAFKTAFAKLGGAAPAPASLGLVLTPLTVPPALLAPPPLPHLAPPAHAVPHPDISSAVGPGGAGLIGKIGGSLAAKVAVVAAAAAVVVGGLTAIRQEQRREPAEAQARPAATRAARGVDASRPVHLLKTRWGVCEWSTAHDLHEIQEWCADRAADAAHDAAHTSSHDSAEHAAHAALPPAGGDVPAPTAVHEGSSGPGSTTSHDSGGSTQASGGMTTHDGGSGGHDGGMDH